MALNAANTLDAFGSWIDEFKACFSSKDKLNVFNGIDFVFFGNNGYFKITYD